MINTSKTYIYDHTVLEKSTYLAGDRLSAADITFAALVRHSPLFPFHPSSFPLPKP